MSAVYLENIFLILMWLLKFDELNPLLLKLGLMTFPKVLSPPTCPIPPLLNKLNLKFSKIKDHPIKYWKVLLMNKLIKFCIKCVTIKVLKITWWCHRSLESLRHWKMYINIYLTEIDCINSLYLFDKTETCTALKNPNFCKSACIACWKFLYSSNKVKD